MVSTQVQESIDVIEKFVATHYSSLVALAIDHTDKLNREFNPDKMPVDYIQHVVLAICADQEKAKKLENVIKENIGIFRYNKDYQFGMNAIVIDIGNHQKLRISYGEKNKHRVKHPAIVRPLIDSIVIPDGNFEFIIDVVPEIYSKNPKKNVPPLNKLEEKLLTQNGQLNHEGNDIRCRDIAILAHLLDKKDIVLTDAIKTNNFGFLSDGRPIVIDLNSAFHKEILGSDKVKKSQRKISNDFLSKLKKNFLPPKNQLPTKEDYERSYAEHLKHLGLKMGEVKGHITLDKLNKAYEEDPANRLLFTIEKLGIYGDDAKKIVALRAQEIIENSKLPDEQKKKLFADAILAARQNSQDKSK